VHIQVQYRAETLYKGDCTGSRCFVREAGLMNQVGGKRAVNNTQRLAHQCGEPANRNRSGNDTLKSHCVGQHFIDKQRRTVYRSSPVFRTVGLGSN
jgi:hypothetical protein